MELKQELLEELKPLGEEQRFNMGEVILREGEKADKVYVVLSGHVSVFKRSPSGEEVFVGLGGPGTVFGEMALFLEGERTATVRASSNVSLLVFSADSFLQAVSKVPELSYMLLKEFSKRVNNLNRRIINITTSKLMYVIGMHLLENVKFEENPYYTPEEGTVELYMRTFAVEYSMEPEKVESVLSALKKAGAINVDRTETVEREGKEDTLYYIRLNPSKLKAYLRSIAHV